MEKKFVYVVVTICNGGKPDLVAFDLEEDAKNFMLIQARQYIEEIDQDNSDEFLLTDEDFCNTVEYFKLEIISS